MTRYFLIGWFMLLLLLTSTATGAAAREWNFRVLLDEREIGYHNFTLSDEGSQSRLLSEASFEVRMLFITLYRYRHQAEEVWRGDCLASMESDTDANGKPLQVRGVLQTNAFQVESSEGVDMLPTCVMSFAYWNPEFLLQDQLLNSQNGAYLDVTISGPAPESINVSGKTLVARRYDLRAEEMALRLWYSESGDWVALEAAAQGGRILRYERLWDEGATL